MGNKYINLRRSAEISDCGQYRWSLRRDWTLQDDKGIHVKGLGVCSFIMLNPSTADGLTDDPTIRRCINFAVKWGYNSLVVRNLFAHRATEPEELLTAENPTGGSIGLSEWHAALTADLVVVAWGGYVPHKMDQMFLDLAEKVSSQKKLYCLGYTKSMKPRHPLFVRGDTQLCLFERKPQSGRI